jgi:hypothetical protein
MGEGVGVLEDIASQPKYTAHHVGYCGGPTMWWAVYLGWDLSITIPIFKKAIISTMSLTQAEIDNVIFVNESYEWIGGGILVTNLLVLLTFFSTSLLYQKFQLHRHERGQAFTPRVFPD